MRAFYSFLHHSAIFFYILLCFALICCDVMLCDVTCSVLFYSFFCYFCLIMICSASVSSVLFFLSSNILNEEGRKEVRGWMDVAELSADDYSDTE